MRSGESHRGALDDRERPALGWLSRAIAFLTTPFKFLGVDGWSETGCDAEGIGLPVRDAQHSTDGFYTIDLRLLSIAVQANPAPEGRFVRLEVEPDTAAHEVCRRTPVRAGVRLAFGGPLVLDEDGPFLEVHPDTDFSVLGDSLRA